MHKQSVQATFALPGCKAILLQGVITQQECLLANQIGQKAIYYVTHPATHKNN